MSQNYDERLGTDRMLPLIFRMAIPAIAAQLVNLLYSLVDRMYIGRIPGDGNDALAGIGITSTIIILISAFSSIVGAGGSPLAAIALGRGDRAQASRILNNGFLLLILFAIATSAVSYLFMHPLLRLAGASETTLPFAASYLSVYLIGTFFVMVTTGLNPYISAQGRAGTAMCSVVIGALLNTILDPLFIFTLGLGVRGAAIATVISQGISAAWVLCFLFSPKASLRLARCDMKPDGSVIGKIFALGVSPFVMASTESLIGFVLNGSLSAFGDIYVSALTIMQSAMQIVSVPLGGFATGVVPILSYNFGHKNHDRVKQCCRIMFVIMFTFNFAIILTMILFPRTIASMFTADAALLDTVAAYMPIFLAGMCIFGLQRACQNTFVALGQARVSLFIALLRKVILLIPLVLILPRFLGVSGVYAGEAVADASAALLCTAIFLFRFPKILRENQAD